MTSGGCRSGEIKNKMATSYSMHQATPLVPKEMNLKSILVKQAIVVPLVATLVPMLIAFTLPEYSSVSQHLSDLGVLNHPVALITRIADIVIGVSILLFGLGVFLSATRRFAFTAITAGIVGASMMSNGVFVTGSPLHGLYGLGLFLPLVPACFAAEFGQNQKVIKLSLAVAVFTMAYLWLMFSGFDPEGYQGLTQRIATIVMWGWYAAASYALLSSDTVPSKMHRNTLAEPT